MKNRRNLLHKVLTAAAAGVMAVALFANIPEMITTSQAADPVVIVIDPGHGGTGDRNLGAQYNGISEKVATLAVANAMKANLEQYQNVKVYMTRTADTYVSLSDRVKYAQSVGADFMYSIHFNASQAHDLCGSEIWISAFDNNYKLGYEFASVEQQELMNLGLYSRGIKTKLGTRGDYYGILRYARSYNVPCALIEHCYIDQGSDLAWLKSQADPYATLGAADATAVAKYFGLSSKTLGVNYSGYKNVSVAAPTSPVAQDTTAPTVCTINSAVRNTSAKTVSANLTCVDPDGMVIYYRYSYDNGKTWSAVVGWNRALQTDTVTIPNPNNAKTLTVECYNQYDLITVSSAVTMK